MDAPIGGGRTEEETEQEAQACGGVRGCPPKGVEQGRQPEPRQRSQVERREGSGQKNRRGNRQGDVSPPRETAAPPGFMFQMEAITPFAWIPFPSKKSESSVAHYAPRLVGYQFVPDGHISDEEFHWTVKAGP